MTTTQTLHIVTVEGTNTIAQTICSCGWRSNVYDTHFGDTSEGIWRKAGKAGETHRFLKQYFEDKKAPSVYSTDWS